MLPQRIKELIGNQSVRDAFFNSISFMDRNDWPNDAKVICDIFSYDVPYRERVLKKNGASQHEIIFNDFDKCNDFIFCSRFKKEEICSGVFIGIQKVLERTIKFNETLDNIYGIAQKPFSIENWIISDCCCELSEEAKGVIIGELVAMGFLIPFDDVEDIYYQKHGFPIKNSAPIFYSSSVKWSDDKQNKIVVLGLPCDHGAKYPGARHGPHEIRNASHHFSFRGNGDNCFDVDSGCMINPGDMLSDYGDIIYDPSLSQMEYHQIIERFAKNTLNSGGIILGIGGDHSLTLPLVKACSSRGINLVHFDAHLDCYNTACGPVDIKHSNFVTHLHRLGSLGKIYHYGTEKFQSKTNDMRELLSKDDIYSDIALNGMSYEEIHKIIPQDKNIYITIDIDVLSDVVAPDTGFPNKHGLQLDKLLRMCSGIIGRNNVVGLDIMEVTDAEHGRTSKTAYIASYILLNIMRDMQKKHIAM